MLSRMNVITSVSKLESTKGDENTMINIIERIENDIRKERNKARPNRRKLRVLRIWRKEEQKKARIKRFHLYYGNGKKPNLVLPNWLNQKKMDELDRR